MFEVCWISIESFMKANSTHGCDGDIDLTVIYNWRSGNFISLKKKKVSGCSTISATFSIWLAQIQCSNLDHLLGAPALVNYSLHVNSSQKCGKLKLLAFKPRLNPIWLEWINQHWILHRLKWTWLVALED